MIDYKILLKIKKTSVYVNLVSNSSLLTGEKFTPSFNMQRKNANVNILNCNIPINATSLATINSFHIIFHD